MKLEKSHFRNKFEWNVWIQNKWVLPDQNIAHCVYQDNGKGKDEHSNYLFSSVIFLDDVNVIVSQDAVD